MLSAVRGSMHAQLTPHSKAKFTHTMISSRSMMWVRDSLGEYIRWNRPLYTSITTIWGWGYNKIPQANALDGYKYHLISVRYEYLLECIYTVFSRVSTHLHVSAHPPFWWSWYALYMQKAYLCKRPPRFLTHLLQAPMGAYSREYGIRTCIHVHEWVEEILTVKYSQSHTHACTHAPVFWPIHYKRPADSTIVLTYTYMYFSSNLHNVLLCTAINCAVDYINVSTAERGGTLSLTLSRG